MDIVTICPFIDISQFAVRIFQKGDGSTYRGKKFKAVNFAWELEVDGCWGLLANKWSGDGGI